jgi:trk system potassium uptake protein
MNRLESVKEKMMKKQIAVIGLGRFGASVASALYREGHEVIAIDDNERNVQDSVLQVTKSIYADATDEAILRKAGIEKFDIGVVAIGSTIESSVLCTLLLKKLKVGYIIARAKNELHGNILEKIGADIVIHPEREMGFRIAQSVIVSDANDYLSVVPGYGITKLFSPDYLVGQKLMDIGFGQQGNWEVAAVLIQRGNEIIITPNPNERVQENDIVIVAGNDDKIEKLLTESKKNAMNQK